MHASWCAGTVQEDGGGRCAGFLEAESPALGELERGDEGAAEELEQHLGGKVLSDEPTVDAARNANWWLPQSLDRLLPHLNVEGSAHQHDKGGQPDPHAHVAPAPQPLLEDAAA